MLRQEKESRGVVLAGIESESPIFPYYMVGRKAEDVHQSLTSRKFMTTHPDCGSLQGDRELSCSNGLPVPNGFLCRPR